MCIVEVLLFSQSLNVEKFECVKIVLVYWNENSFSTSYVRFRIVAQWGSGMCCSAVGEWHDEQAVLHLILDDRQCFVAFFF